MGHSFLVAEAAVRFADINPALGCFFRGHCDHEISLNTYGMKSKKAGPLFGGKLMGMEGESGGNVTRNWMVFGGKLIGPYFGGDFEGKQ